jgi:hypothetical protein
MARDVSKRGRDSSDAMGELNVMCSRAALTVLVAGVIAACQASVAPSIAPVATPNATPASPTPMATSNLEPTVTPRSANPAPTPRPDLTATPVPVPPKPTGVAFDEKRVGDDPTTTEITQIVRWAAPRSEGVEIRVYGVTECIARPASPSPDTGGACLVEHTPVPASVRTLLATAPASDGVASWTWTGTFDCEIGLAYDPRGPAYHSIVLAAYSASGHSIFAIAVPGAWWQPGPNDIIC